MPQNNNAGNTGIDWGGYYDIDPYDDDKGGWFVQAIVLALIFVLIVLGLLCALKNG